MNLKQPSLYDMVKSEGSLRYNKRKKHCKGIGEISDTFLIKICSDRLTNLKNRCIILYAKANGNTIRTCE